MLSHALNRHRVAPLTTVSADKLAHYQVTEVSSDSLVSVQLDVDRFISIVFTVVLDVWKHSVHS